MKGLANPSGIIVLQYINTVYKCIKPKHCTSQITQWYILIISQFLNDKIKFILKKQVPAIPDL